MSRDEMAERTARKKIAKWSAQDARRERERFEITG